MKVADKFANLFAGYQHAHGTFEATHTENGGKKTGNFRTIRGKISAESWEEHLKGGDTGLGIIPLMDDNKLLFAAIDIDDYNLDHKALCRNIKLKNYPLVVCKSKSGGAHCYLFLSEPVSAEEITKKMSTWCASLGFGGSEIFPKQTYRIDTKDTGNWINIPYFDGDNSVRKAIALNKDGELVELSLEQFITYAVGKKKSAQELGVIKTPVELIDPDRAEIFKDGPPCLCEYVALGEIPAGRRNEEMFNVAGMLKKKYPDNWQDETLNQNNELCKPPLPNNEVQAIIKSIERKGYDLKCNGPFCNPKLCRQAKYGIGEHQKSVGRPNVEQVTKHEGDPVLWYFTIDNKRVVFNTDDLYAQSSFNKICMDVLGRCPTPMPAAKWAKQLDEWVSEADIVPAMQGASTKDTLRDYLEKFCTASNRQARTMDEVAQGKPFRKDGKITFKSTPLQEFLNEKRFKFNSAQELLHMLRDLTNLEDKRVRASGTTHAVWVMDDIFEEADENVPNEPVFDKEVF